MSKAVPDHIVTHYGSARAFKGAKRAALRRLRVALRDLRNGSAYFPGDRQQVARIERAVEALEHDLSVKVWGR